MRRTRDRVLTLLVGCMLVTGCGGRSEDDVELAIRRLEAKRDVLKSQLAALDAVDTSRAGAPLVVATVHPAEVEKAFRGAVPFPFDASTLHPYVGGQIEVLGIRQVEVDRDRAIRFQLLARGKEIKLKVAVPGAYRKMAKELVAGLKAGVEISMQGNVYSTDDGRAYFFGNATGARLKKHAKKQYHDMIRQGVNTSLLNRPHPIDVDPIRVGKTRLPLRGVLPVNGKLAMIFAP